jgi:hypothetical protein
MKKIILILVSILILTGCSNTNETTTYDEVTTYKEVIEDNKVVIDGISYNIESVTTETITYDKKDRVLIKDISHDYIEENAKSSFQASDITTKYSYKGDFLIEMAQYNDDVINATSYFKYNDKQLEEIKMIKKDGSILITEYTYGEGFITTTNFDSEGEMIASVNMTKDENDRFLSSKTIQEDFTSTSIYHYDDNLLSKNVVTSHVKLTNENLKSGNTTNYEYNNIGDKIVTYTTYDGDVDFVKVEFYDYEYNDEMLPTIITKHTVHSPIDKENIRHY